MVTNSGKSFLTSEDALDVVKKLLFEKSHIAHPSSHIFSGGAVGYISYDYGMKFENIPSRHGRTNTFPEIFFGLYDELLCFNHKTNEWSVNSTERGESSAEQLMKQFTNHDTRTTNQVARTHFLIPDFKKEEYIRAVEKAKKYIEDGDIYQVNFTHRFWGKTGSSALTIYNQLREKNPAPYSALMCIDANKWIMSSSPELFFTVKGKTIATHPIKGTIQRGTTAEEDALLQQQLIASEKDAAELLMIVDLERNDLNRVCKTGTVNVKDLKHIETFETVHHLVANVHGELHEDCSVIDAFRALFPGGSITGAPKIRAMQIIDELEKCRRGIYTGAIGWLGFDGNAEFNIAIRTMMMEEDSVWFNVGGGIVADSIPEKEFEETMYKADGMLRALNVNAR